MNEDQAVFGSGELWGIDTDANATPVQFGTLQDVSLDASFTQKELRGQKLFAEKINNSEGKITGKAKFGRLNGVLVNRLFFKGTLSAGRELIVSGEAANVPAAAPETVVVANGATFVSDLGVKDGATGNPFDKVDAAPAAGQYMVDAATGTYTFAAADGGKAVLISYTYTDVGGHTVKVTNALAGNASRFAIILREQDDEGEFGVKLYSCTSNKLSLATKMGDFMIPEFDFAAAADAAGNVIDLFFE